MRLFEELIEKISSNKKWFRGTMSVLVTALVVILGVVVFLPEAKANAIVDDPTAKTMTYNLAAIAANSSGTQGVVEVEVDVNDPEYKYYIVGDGTEYMNISFVVKYNIGTSQSVPIYLDNVNIHMTENAPALKFEPSTNGTNDLVGSYKVIVKGDCSMRSSCAGATYPVIQVESVLAKLYQLKAYNGDDYLNVENYYDIISSGFETKVEFTSYEFADGEPKTECSLEVVTANESYGAGIGTTAGNVDISAENVVLSDGTGQPINDLADGSLMRIFNKPLKVGAQAMYGSAGVTGDITISGALNLKVIGNGYGACIGGGGSYNSSDAAKEAGNVTIKGGTLYIDARDVVKGNNVYNIPAIGGGFNTDGGTYGVAKDVVITGGSVYVRDNGVQFGADGAQPVNAKGEKLSVFETDYVNSIDENGRLIISSERYEETYKGDISVTDDYVDVYLEYNSADYTEVLNYAYEGFGHDEAFIGTGLYFYLPATPLCSLSIDQNSFLEEGMPTITVEVDDKELTASEGAYWMAGGSDAIVTIKNIPEYIDIENIIVTDTKTNVPTDYSGVLVYDETTGDYTITVRVSSDSVLSIVYDSEIVILYDNGFVDGDTHEVINNSPVDYDLGQEIILDNGLVYADDLIFEGWYSEITGEKITYINEYNIDSIMDAAGRIKLKAKWNITVSYDFGEGTGEAIPEVVLPYGESTDIVISNVIPTLEYYEFEGWLVDGAICDGGYVYTTVPTSNIVITASYVQDSFFVYIDADPKKFNSENVELYVVLNGNTLTAANNLLQKNPDGSYRTKEINGVMYYSAVVEDAANVAIVIIPKSGRMISGQHITVTEGKGNQIQVGTSGGEDGEITIQLTIDEDDVYISTASEFILREYEIKFYDGNDLRGGEQLWADQKFIYTIEDLQTPIKNIVGEQISQIETYNGRFYKFAGWKDMLSGKVYKNEDALLENLGDVILVAQWTEVEKYPIEIDVIDVETDKISDDVFAELFYVNADGSLEAIYKEKVLNESTMVMETITYVKENDRIAVKFFYYNNDGVKTEVTDGVTNEGIVLKYSKDTGSNATEEVDKGSQLFVCPKIKAGTVLKVTVDISIKEYRIAYWDTRELKHNNPTTYTFFDQIELENIYEEVGWVLVGMTDGEITTTPIDSIDRGTVGNLVLKADWESYVKKMYQATIDTLVENGKIEIVYPVERDTYLPNETIVVQVIPNPGYRLKNNVILYRDAQEINLNTNIFTSFTLRRDVVMYGAVEVTGEDGVYLVEMPEKNIVITAQFELIEYKIEYIVDEGVQNNNVTSYTIYDDIDLLPVEKEGYEFVGWADENGNIINKISNMTTDLVLTALFEEAEEETTEDSSEESTEGSTDNSSEEESKDDSNTDEEETSNNNNQEEESTTDDSDVNAGKPGASISGGSSSNDNEEPTTNNKNDDKTHLIGGGNAYGGDLYTGDSSDVTRLVLISVAAVILLFIVVLSKKRQLD